MRYSYTGYNFWLVNYALQMNFHMYVAWFTYDLWWDLLYSMYSVAKCINLIINIIN